MALIEDTKEGRINGSYTRLLGNDELGQLISRCHATTIRAGNELEKKIEEQLPLLGEKDFSFFKNKQFDKCELKKFVLSKQQVKDLNFFSNQPDFFYCSLEDKIIYLIELKDGDTFDTKKSLGEISVLENCINILKNMPEFSDFHIDYKFTSFNAVSKTEVIKGLKGKILERNTFTGEDFSDLLEIDYNKTKVSRELDCEKNVVFFLTSFLKITSLRKIIIKMMLSNKQYTQELYDNLMEEEKNKPQK